ncbi:MAG: DUF3810 domain-containing protein [Sediminibacterium sp.]|nr:DUF3810 domain-containing protein [Sediminibacterium sp.]
MAAKILNALKINTQSTLFFWILLAISVFGCSQSIFFVETFYAKSIYPRWSGALNWLFGWIPFSVGDIIYMALFFYLGFKLIKAVQFLIKNKLQSVFRREIGRVLLVRVLQIYVYFMLSWGLLYNRSSIEEQMGWERVNPASVADLHALRCELIDSVRILRNHLGSDTVLKRPNWKELQVNANKAYDSLHKQFPSLANSNSTVKPTLLNKLGKYIGFTGYFNPFTHEAQVRAQLPAMALPSVITHEIAHQLGQAGESEASWYGFLAAKSSNDLLFRYSAYMDLLFLVDQALFDQDEEYRKMYVGRYKAEVDIMVRMDRKQYLLFFLNEETNFSSWVQDISKATYQTYLVANGESAGLASYQLWLHWAVHDWKKRKGHKN